MPVNSFDQYPMSWKPDRAALSTPLYRSLAHLLEQDILSGALPPHTKLPPQRELADFLDLNLSTITRTFQLCERRGLLYAITGKGTFVSPNAAASIAIADGTKEQTIIEMGIIKALDQFNQDTLDVMRTVLTRNNSIDFLDYSNPLGSPYQRSAGKKWLERFGLDLPADQIAITSGSQNALTIALLSLFQAGDKIATDHYTYSNFIELANMMHIQLIPISNDTDGMVPEELETQCRLHHLRGIYLIPTFSNPVGITMSTTRKQEIASIIRQYHLTLIEDDIYAFLTPDTIPPLAYYVPDCTFYISSLSKSLCSGLRVAYVAYPKRFADAMQRGIYNVNIKTPSWNSETVGELIYSGVADSILQKKAVESQHRAEICRRFFPADTPQNVGFSVWLPLPSVYSHTDFESLALRHGIRVCHSQRFLVGKDDPQQYLRVALSSPETSEELAHGLGILQRLFYSAPNIEPPHLII